MKLGDLIVHAESGVLVPPQEGTAATYLDGAEQYLLDALRRAKDVSVFSPELRSSVRDWASLYHLTPYRATILDALGLAPEARLLELGAGCGAVTRWLGEHFAAVDTVEGSLARARVARERCRDLPGVRVCAANFFDLDFENAYDIATLIGVLEYSHLYHPELRDDPAGAALSNLELARRSLADDGLLVIAIENKLGLKYLSGSHEDHAARRFEGVEGYPSRDSAVTWSAAELERLVLAAGFAGADFYLPFPDYKLARTVFDAAETDESSFPANWVETPFPDHAGTQTEAPFNESLALREIAAGGLLRELANSFVVLAYNGERERVRERLGVESGWIARHYSFDRRIAFGKRTSLEQGADGGLVVRNRAAVPGVPAPEPGLALTQRLEDEPFRPGHQLLFAFHEAAAGGRLGAELPGLLAELHAFLVREYGTGRTDRLGLPLLRGEAIDATPWNIVIDPETGAWHSIDGEWRFDAELPIDVVLWRGLHHAAARHRALLAGSGAGSPAEFAFAAVCSLLPAVTVDRFGLYEEIEQLVQRAAGAETGVGGAAITPRLRALLGPAESAGTFTVLADAEELIDSPELIATFSAAFPDGGATLVVYAPDADAAEIAPRLEAALAEHAEGDPEVVLLAVARTDDTVASSARALLSARAAAAPFAGLPRITPGEGERLRALASPPKAAPELPSEPTGPTPSVSIVIPVFNRLDLTKQCLDTLRETIPERPYEVIVVDNASTDGTADYLRAEQTAGRLRCVINPENAGFGSACNQGAEFARGEFLLLLNNDTIPQAGWLEPLVVMLGDSTVGIAGCRLLYPEGTVQHAGIVWDKDGRLTHIHRGLPANDPAVRVEHDFAAVTGACLLIRRKLFTALGAFDTEAFHMYVEDVDLCIRVWEAGLRVTYCPASVLVHLENASVTDIAWRDENVVAGWRRLNERWFGRWPHEVRRLAWPHALGGSAKHLAVLSFADDVLAHPELLVEFSRVFDPHDAKLLVYGEGYEPGALSVACDELFANHGIEAAALDVLALAAPTGFPPPPNLVAAVSAVLSSERPEGELGALPWADETAVERLRGTSPGIALARRLRSPLNFGCSDPMKRADAEAITSVSHKNDGSWPPNSSVGNAYGACPPGRDLGRSRERLDPRLQAEHHHPVELRRRARFRNRATARLGRFRRGDLEDDGRHDPGRAPEHRRSARRRAQRTRLPGRPDGRRNELHPRRPTDRRRPGPTRDSDRRSHPRPGRQADYRRRSLVRPGDLDKRRDPGRGQVARHDRHLLPCESSQARREPVHRHRRREARGHNREPGLARGVGRESCDCDDRHDRLDAELRGVPEGDLVDRRDDLARHRLGRIGDWLMPDGIYAAGAGMAAQQTRMDYLANDIANLNTTGYQSQRIGFEDLVYSAEHAPNEQTVPVGAGATTFSLGPDQAQGSMQQTGDPLDLALTGPGYFQVKRSDGSTALTRDGNLALDASGNIVTSTGEQLEPPVQAPKGTKPSDIAIAVDGTISIAGKSIGKVTVVNVPSASGLDPVGGSLFMPTAASGKPFASATQVQQGALETSNVDLATTMSQMIDAQRSYEFASEAIKTQSELLDVANQITK